MSKKKQKCKRPGCDLLLNHRGFCTQQTWCGHCGVQLLSIETGPYCGFHARKDQRRVDK